MVKKVFLYIAVLSVPLSLLAVTGQSERYAALSAEVARVTEQQTKIIEENRRLIAEIAVLSSSARIEQIAKTNLGLERKPPEEVIEVTIKNNKPAPVSVEQTGG
jgi:cell division protein FtsL